MKTSEQMYLLEEMHGNIFEFLKYVRIVEPGEQSISFDTPPHIVQFFHDLAHCKFLWVLKAKQVYVSWSLAAQALYDIYFIDHANVIEISQGDIYAQRLLEKSKIIYFNLPQWMQQYTLEPNSTEAFGFKERGSRIRAYPSTKTATIGETASRVIHDEADFHEYAEENLAHTRATVNDIPLAKLVAVTTSDKSNPDTPFKGHYKLAQKGAPNHKALFFSYDCNPRRSEEWYNRERQIAIDNGTLELFEGNYPRTEDEALSPMGATSVFDGEVLKKLWDNTIENKNGRTHIFQKAQVGVKYAAGVDVGEGVGLDYSVLTIIGKYGGQSEVAAVIYSNDIPTDIFAYECMQLCETYFNPLLGVENNSIGIAVLNKLQELNYRNLFYNDIGKKKVGWTTGDTSKEIAITELRQAIDNESLITRFKPQVKELMEYQYVRGRSGKIKPNPSGKTHGDTVISLAIANQMLKRVRTDLEITIYDYDGRKI